MSEKVRIEMRGLKVEGPALFVLPVGFLYCVIRFEVFKIALTSKLPAEVIIKLIEAIG